MPLSAIDVQSPALINVYKDSYEFHTADEQVFLDTCADYGSTRQVETIKTEELRFYPMPSALQAYLLEALGLPGHCIRDSIDNNTRLYMEWDGEPYLLRDRALSSVMERLRIGGTVLSDIPKELLAQHLNSYAEHADEKGTMIYNHGKVTGIMGKNYPLLPAEEIMQITSDYMANQKALFNSGMISHKVIRASWDMGDCRIDLPIAAGQTTEVFSQTVSVWTSDCGMKSVNILPVMRREEDPIALAYSLPLRMEHKGSASMEKYQDMLELLTRHSENAVKTVQRLSAIELTYPVNAVLGLFKGLDIPAKYGAPVFEKKKLQWKDSSVKRTAFDCYSALSEVAALVMSEEKNKKTLMEYQESYMRGLHFKFIDYDVPGDYSYNTEIIGTKAVSRRGKSF